MAQTLITTKMRAIGTAGGQPPHVETMIAEEAIGIGDVLTVLPSSGRVQIANGTVLVTAGTADQIDISDLVNATEGFLAGVSLGKAAAAGDKVQVAMAGPGQLFEANLQSTQDGTTVVGLALLQAHVGEPCAVVLLDTGQFVLSDVEGTETAAIITRVGYGFAGEDTFSGHGVIGDTNARVTFKFVDNLTLLGQ